MNILYIGSSGALSLTPFTRLLQESFDIVAVGTDRPLLLDNRLIAVENASLALAARQQLIPVLDLSQPIEAVLDTCHQLAVDLILMSCYGRRLPDEIINCARYGCFNMHPSLLPRFRGPEPVFWQMQQASVLGVSWHQVVHEFDAGAVVAEKRVLVDDGVSFGEINQQLAADGAALLLKLLSELTTATVVFNPQNPEVASYFAYPKPRDFVVDTQWRARHAFNFMRATAAYGQSYTCTLQNHRYLLDKAVDFDNNLTLDEPAVQAERLFIPCREGVLIARYTDRIRV